MKNVIKAAIAGLALVSGVAFAAPQTVELSWNDAGAETSYVLQRFDGPCSAVNASGWTTKATLPADTISYTDTANGGASYCYRVAAQVGGVNQGWSNLHQVDVVDTIVPITLTGGQV